jgi:methylated-DNA-[protein]-cysteine S-methyltransferase
MARLSFVSPLGRLTLFEENGALTALIWGGKSAGEASPLLHQAKRQLDAYFAGRRRSFDLPMAPSGSPSEQRVWTLMATIPYGETRSYGELARNSRSAHARSAAPVRAIPCRSFCRATASPAPMASWAVIAARVAPKPSAGF